MGSVRTGSDITEEMRDKATLPPGRPRDARADDTDHGSPRCVLLAFWLPVAASHPLSPPILPD